jgi:pimeloyl-ACP methyl ester carboxylesterase
MNKQNSKWLALCGIVWPSLVGCASALPDRAERMERGYVYYLDGAGGGSVVSNWAGGVRRGMLDAGYDGAGEMFTWQTGKGVLADQVASAEYKREKAAELAQRIQSFHQTHPDAKISLVGLSAGTVVAVFTLEALPAKVPIESVVLLSGSLSADYDLGGALKKVRDKVYVFSSTKDGVLQVLLPMAGTADRAKGTTETIGVQGPKLPSTATARTRELYAERVVEIPWNAEFSAYGHHGGHTDTVKASFVRHFVAPFLRPLAPQKARPAKTSPMGKVDNPDYRRWARFEPGSWAAYEGEQIADGVSTPIQLKATLKFKSETALLVERDTLANRGTGVVPRHLFVTAAIDPRNNPLTHPDGQVENHADELVDVDGHEIPCRVFSVHTPGDSLAWGRDVRATVHVSDAVPGGIVRMDLVTHIDGRQVHYRGQLVGFEAVPGGSASAR